MRALTTSELKFVSGGLRMIEPVDGGANTSLAVAVQDGYFSGDVIRDDSGAVTGASWDWGLSDNWDLSGSVQNNEATVSLDAYDITGTLEYVGGQGLDFGFSGLVGSSENGLTVGYGSDGATAELTFTSGSDAFSVGFSGESWTHTFDTGSTVEFSYNNATDTFDITWSESLFGFCDSFTFEGSYDFSDQNGSLEFQCYG